MASTTSTLRPLSCWKSLLRATRRQKAVTRMLSTYHHSKPAHSIPISQLPTTALGSITPHVNRKIPTYPPPPTPAATFKDPVQCVERAQIAELDPTGARTELFSRTNPEAARTGDILLVRQRSGDQFAGVCISIRRRGVDSAILLRNELTRIGVEMWYKIYSPNVQSIEVVQRMEKRPRRARLTYMRKPKHDMRSVEIIVQQYQRQRMVLTTAEKQSRQHSGKKGRKKGKKH